MESACANGEQLAERVRGRTIERSFARTIAARRSVPLNSPVVGRATRRIACLLIFASAARTAGAQESVIQRLGLDKLQIASLGISAGRILPSQVDPTMVYAISADYGEIAPNWRVNFTSSYWSSKYRDAVVRAFVDSLNKRIVDPTGTARVP